VKAPGKGSVAYAVEQVTEYAQLIGSHDRHHDLRAYVQAQRWLFAALELADAHRSEQATGVEQPSLPDKPAVLELHPGDLVRHVREFGPVALVIDVDARCADRHGNVWVRWLTGPDKGAKRFYARGNLQLVYHPAHAQED
jgi:hypothetical protein